MHAIRPRPSRRRGGQGSWRCDGRSVFIGRVPRSAGQGDVEEAMIPFPGVTQVRRAPLVLAEPSPLGRLPHHAMRCELHEKY